MGKSQGEKVNIQKNINIWEHIPHLLGEGVFSNLFSH